MEGSGETDADCGNRGQILKGLANLGKVYGKGGTLDSPFRKTGLEDVWRMGSRSATWMQGALLEGCDRMGEIFTNRTYRYW